MMRLLKYVGFRKCVFRLSVVLVALLVPGPKACAQFDIVFWNLENFFDYFDDGGSSSDADFSSQGSRRWTKARFTKKCNMVGKALLWIGENRCGGGKAPAVVGVAEVENAFVLNRLVNSPVLRKMNYWYVHYNSPDRRGIDVALLYRRDMVKMLSSRPVHIYGDDGALMRTRDILYAYIEFRPESGASGIHECSEESAEECSEEKAVRPSRIHILVNHHPSKFSGEKASMRGRELAMMALRNVCDSIMRVSDDLIVAMGDFYDTPDGAQFNLLEGRLTNLAEPLFKRGEGSIRFDGRRELIDHFLVGNDEGLRPFEMSVVQVPFLMTEDRTHTGFKPMRTYVGPRYAGGVSDHCPILLEISQKIYNFGFAWRKSPARHTY